MEHLFFGYWDYPHQPFRAIYLLLSTLPMQLQQEYLVLRNAAKIGKVYADHVVFQKWVAMVENNKKGLDYLLPKGYERWYQSTIHYDQSRFPEDANLDTQELYSKLMYHHGIEGVKVIEAVIYID